MAYSLSLPLFRGVLERRISTKRQNQEVLVREDRKSVYPHFSQKIAEMSQNVIQGL